MTAKLEMPCPFCGDPARVKPCKEKPGKPGMFYWYCECQARGFFTDSHFKALEKAKKIFLRS
jgi:hypothetical protein